MPKTFREESSNDTPPHVGISHYDTEAPYIQCPMPGSMRLLRVSDKSGYWSLWTEGWSWERCYDNVALWGRPGSLALIESFIMTSEDGRGNNR